MKEGQRGNLLVSWARREVEVLERVEGEGVVGEEQGEAGIGGGEVLGSEGGKEPKSTTKKKGKKGMLLRLRFVSRACYAERGEPCVLVFQELALGGVVVGPAEG